MSMQVSGSEKYYRNDYLEKLQEMEDKAKRIGNRHVGNRSEGMVIPKDAYISSEESGTRPSGLYRMGQDGNGNRRVLYDDPKKTTMEMIITNESFGQKRRPGQTALGSPTRSRS